MRLVIDVSSLLYLEKGCGNHRIYHFVRHIELLTIEFTHSVRKGVLGSFA